MKKLSIYLRAVGLWLRDSPRAASVLALAGVAIASLLFLAHLFGSFPHDYIFSPWPDLLLDVDNPVSRVAFDDKAFLFRELQVLAPIVGRYYILALLLSLPALAAAMLRERSIGGSWFKPLFFTGIAVLAAWLPYELLFRLPEALTSQLGEEPAPFYCWLKLLLVGLLILLPSVAAFYYDRAGILDRYVLRGFFTPLALCFFGMFAIWFIIDIFDNGPDLFANASIGRIAWFYLVHTPQVTMLILPVTLLLAVLYVLGRMSRSNEIVAMLGVGRSMTEVLAPIFVFSFLACTAAVALNYEWAPWAEGHQMATLEKYASGGEEEAAAINQLHHNSVDNRTWFIGLIPFDLSGKSNKLRNVEVRQFDPDGQLMWSLFARSAGWFSGNGNWKFYTPVVYRYREGDLTGSASEPSIYFEKWRETPWLLISSSFKPEYLGVPQLASFLKTNADEPVSKTAPFRTHFWYRWAMPFSCLVVVLVAAPLGVVYSRRGVLGGVAASIFIFALLYFFSNFALALGKGHHLPGFVAAWITNGIFLIIGGYLYYCRARNREVIRFPKLFRRAHA